MRKIFITTLLLLFIHSIYAQTSQHDSLKSLIRSAKDDSTKFYGTAQLIWGYIYTNMDSATVYIRQNILLAKNMKSNVALDNVYWQYWTLQSLNGNYSESLQYRIRSLRLAEQRGDLITICVRYNGLGDTYREIGDLEKSIYYHRKAKALLEPKLDPILEKEKNENVAGNYVYCLVRMALTFERFNKLDSALKYANYTSNLYPKTSVRYHHMFSTILAPLMGNIYAKKGNYTAALTYYRKGVAAAERNDGKKDVMDNCIGIASTFKKMGQLDSSIYYANKVLGLSKDVYNVIVKLDALNLLADTYKIKHNSDSIAKYLQLTITTKDSLFNTRKIIDMQNMTFDDELKQRELKDREQQYKNRLQTYVLVGGLIMFLLIAGILYRNNVQKQKANLKIEKAYEELKTTQTQIIQKEKMASLGELTAGIAHEIQNPLNFVNNFSEVSTELIEELREEIKADRKDDALAIADDLNQNLQKISQHGSRASSIVKGMLEHSRSSTGEKQLTELNKLADEYLRLAYHGLRAKDKDFNAELITHFDQQIGQVDVAPQEIGRVLLNLFNNAFYAVQQRQKEGRQGYQPTVTVTTEGHDNRVEIRVRDNGMGIPKDIKEKIFQPFFTTKPTGQGTGLGLSLSYDIITKGHGGTIDVNTKVGEGTEFIISLPNTTS